MPLERRRLRGAGVSAFALSTLIAFSAYDDAHKTYRLHDDEDDDDAEICFLGLCCETILSPALAWLAKLQAFAVAVAQILS